MTFPTLETERLILRLPIQEDFDAGWADFHLDEECMRYIGGAMPRSLAWRSLAQVVGMWSLRGFGQFSAIERETGQWVGRIGLWEPEGWPAPEIGWTLHRRAWGKGYAVEAAEACLGYAFVNLGWSRVAHMIHPDNKASQAVAKRLGSSWIDDIRLPPPLDGDVIQMWGQTAAEWKSRARSLPEEG